MTARLLHLVRGGVPPAAAVADADWIVYREPDDRRWRLDAQGAPPLPPGFIDHGQLVQLVLAADRVVAW